MRGFSKPVQKKPGVHLEPLSQVSNAPSSNVTSYMEDRKNVNMNIANVKAKSKVHC